LKKPIPFPVHDRAGSKATGGRRRIINGYVEELGDQAPGKTVIRRGPGLVNFGTSARTGFRGSIVVNIVLYAAYQRQAGEVDERGRGIGQRRQSERHQARVLRGQQ
jgi:hypothetical protein